MIYQNYNDIVSDELIKGAIFNDEFAGFHEDYAVIHCLIRKYRPQKFLEIGTNTGTGTNIICNAGSEWGIDVYSIDLPQDLSSRASEYLGESYIGTNCKRSYTQLWGDSMSLDYNLGYDGIFIDGEHNYTHVIHESKESIRAGIKYIIYHDSDIEGVYNAIRDAFATTDDYIVYRVINTRITYAIRK